MVNICPYLLKHILHKLQQLPGQIWQLRKTSVSSIDSYVLHYTIDVLALVVAKCGSTSNYQTLSRLCRPD
ncbi:hypothetical protein FKM82_019516 [Ascaphus truei]